MAKNGQKHHFVSTRNVFLTKKLAKTAKIRIFLDTTLPLNYSKQLSPVSGKVLDKSDVWFQRKCPKTWLLSENGKFLDQKDFGGHLGHMETQLHAKKSKGQGYRTGTDVP